MGTQVSRTERMITVEGDQSAGSNPSSGWGRGVSLAVGLHYRSGCKRRFVSDRLPDWLSILADPSGTLISRPRPDDVRAVACHPGP